MTLGDASGRSVVLTLWNDNAHSPLLEGAEGQVLQVRGGLRRGADGLGAGAGMVWREAHQQPGGVLQLSWGVKSARLSPKLPPTTRCTCSRVDGRHQVTNIRVGDYNGCSASSGMRSVVTLNPDSKGQGGTDCQGVRRCSGQGRVRVERAGRVLALLPARPFHDPTCPIHPAISPAHLPPAPRPRPVRGRRAARVVRGAGWRRLVCAAGRGRRRKRRRRRGRAAQQGGHAVQHPGGWMLPRMPRHLEGCH